MEVLHAGNVLEVVDTHPQLSVFLFDTQVDQAAHITGPNLIMGCGMTLNAPGLGSTIGDTESNVYSVKLFSEIVGSLARKYRPWTIFKDVFKLESHYRIGIKLVMDNSSFNK